MTRTIPSRKSPTVRLARRGDRERVEALFGESERLHARLHPVYFRGEVQLDARLVDALDGVEHRAIFVADLGLGVVGFVHVEVMEPKARRLMGRRGHIDTLVVDPAARKRGCGRALVERASEWARERGAVELLLTVWAGNRAAERFYEKIGLTALSSVMRMPL